MKNKHNMHSEVVVESKRVLPVMDRGRRRAPLRTSLLRGSVQYLTAVSMLTSNKHTKSAHTCQKSSELIDRVCTSTAHENHAPEMKPHFVLTFCLTWVVRREGRLAAVTAGRLQRALTGAAFLFSFGGSLIQE